MTRSAASRHSWATGWTGERLLAVAGLSVVLALLLWHLADLLSYIVAALHYPYQLDYGEGIVWQQMRDIVNGTGYAPLQVYPAVVYHYPPVYHALSAAAAGLTGMDPLYAGRLVSILSSFATAWMAAMLVMQVLPPTEDRRVRLLCATLAGLLFLCCHPVRMWTPLMRVDMLAGAFSLAGILLALRAPARPGMIYAAGLMFVLAMFTKQISVAAPAATFLILLAAHPKLALRGIAFSAILGLVLLAVMTLTTDGNFLRHIVGYNVNRIDLGVVGGVLIPQLVMHAVILMIAGIGCVTLWRAMWRGTAGGAGIDALRIALTQDRRVMATAIVLVFIALKTIMLVGMVKSGSGYNYMIEWLSGLAIAAGVAFRPVAGRAFGGTDREVGRLMPPLLLVALPLQLVVLHLGLPGHGMLPDLEKQRHQIVDMIAHAPRPVIADDMTFLIRAGKNVRWESAITAELGAKGVYDQGAFANLVRARCFAFFVIEGNVGEPPFTQRYNPVVAAALVAAYPLERRIGKYILHFPMKPAEKTACRTVR